MNLNRHQLLPGAAFIILLSASVYLNLHLFKSLSTVIHTSTVLAAIGVALDLTKASAIGLAMGRGAFSVTVRMTMGVLFTAVSILASATMINATLASTTGDISSNVDSLSVMAEQIETQQEYIATLQERLRELPAEWPRNREQIIGHIREAQTDLDALTDERTELLSSKQSNCSPPPGVIAECRPEERLQGDHWNYRQSKCRYQNRTIPGHCS